MKKPLSQSQLPKNSFGALCSERPPPTLRWLCMDGGCILVETNGAALHVASSLLLRVAGISLLKNTARIAAQEWTVLTMTEYIEREKLYKNLVLLAKYETGERQQGILGCAETVRIFSAANVAPVVHCRHCRSYNKPRLGWCSVHLDREGPDDFCSYGVRMDGDAE